MIVQCPQCASRYRVNDANVPPSGGRITCPSCSHKFVVYPDQDNTQQGAAQQQEADPDKTSVVERPSLERLAGAMRDQKQGGSPPQQEDDAPATEVMSGDALSGMFGGADPTQSDGTVEMQNPYKEPADDASPQEPSFDGGATEVVSGDAVGGMLEGLQNQSGGQQQQQQQQNQQPRQQNQQPRQQNQPEESQTTVESDPPDLGDFQSKQRAGQNQRQQNAPQSPGNAGRAQGQNQQQPPKQPTGQARGGGGSQQNARSGGGPPPQPQSSPSPPQTPGQSGSSGPGSPPSTPGGASGASSPPAQPGGSPNQGASPAGSQQSPPPQPASPASASNESIQEFSPDPEPEAPPQSGGAEPAADDGQNADYDGPWKLKTNFGLTYEFPDTGGLKNWLSNREELDGYQLAGEDGNFKPLDQWPQISDNPGASQQLPSYDQGGGSGPPASQSGSRPSASGPGGPSAPAGGAGPPQQPSQPSSGGPSQPPSPGAGPSGSGQHDSIPPGKKINPQEFRPPSQEAKWNKVLWVVFLVLALVATAIGLQTFEIYDVKGLVLGESSQEESANKSQPPTPKKDSPEKAEKAEKAKKADAEGAEDEREQRLDEQIEQLLSDAERARDNNRLQTALDKLNRAKQLDAERPKVFDMLATVYKKMGQTEDAESAEAEAKRLREQSLSKNEKGGDGTEKSEN